MPWAISLPTVVLIARAVFLLERGQTHTERQRHKRTDPRRAYLICLNARFITSLSIAESRNIDKLIVADIRRIILIDYVTGFYRTVA